MRQLALATALHHDALGYFPPARYQSRPDAVQSNKCGLETPTWLARVMPFIEQSTYGGRWDFSKVWYGHEEDLLTAVPDIYLCPSRRSGQNSVGVRNLAQASGWAPCGCPIHLVRHLSFVEHFVTIQEIMVISHLELLEMRQIFITEGMALVSLSACDQSA